MTVHVLHAGDGYTYLTRQVASGDEHRQRGQELSDYYTAEGNPPGRWLGEGLVSLEVSGQVREDQMKALFGEGLHPDADRITAERAELYVRAGESPQKAALAAQNDVRLGRRFPQFAPAEGDWTQRLHAAYDAEAKRRGLPSSTRLDEETRIAVRHDLAVTTFVELHHREPDTVAELRAWVALQSRKPRQPVAGYDLVFTPVKSVSVLWALGGDDLRREVEAAHEAAVLKSLGHVQQHAARTRTGAGGVAQIDTHGLVVAAFDHRDSRTGDPNLHTHCAVSTKVQGSDGQWRSLDGRVLFALGVSASETYNTAIEDELRARLGVRFVERAGSARDKRPVREIDGLDPALLTHFSQRRAAVEALYRAKAQTYREQYGHEPPRGVQARLAQEATLESRAHKAPAKSLRDQRSEWLDSARAVLGGLTGDQVREQVGAVTGHRHVPTSVALTNTGRWGRRVVERVETDRSTWTRWHLQAEAERQLRSLNVGPADRARLVEQVTAAAMNEHSITLAAPPGETARPAALIRGDGESVFEVHGAQRYSSTRILDAEQRLVDAAKTPARSLITAAAVAAAVQLHKTESGFDLDARQVEVAAAFATAPRLLVAGIGPAGTGKTTSMRLLVDAANMSGRKVMALAPSAAAAEVLAGELGISTDTVHKLLHTLETNPARVDLRPGDVLLVDEAGMVGTLQLQRLADLAEERGALLRLLGDPQQLAAVESGGALRLIEQEVGAARLSQVYRFRQPAEAAASLQLRQGHPAGLEFYEAALRIHGASREAITGQVFQAWATDHAAGSVALMVAARADVVTELSARARLARGTAGEIDLAGPAIALHDGNQAGVGDRVVTRQNARLITCRAGRDFVKNGDLWTVADVGADGSLDIVHTRHRGRVRLDADYVRSHVELGYASTIHRAQGMTTDTCHVVVEESMSRQALYVAATRGRDANHLHAVTDHLLDVDMHHPPGDEASPREVLEHVLGRDASERSATETLREELTSSASLSRLVPQYEHALRRDIDDRHDLRALARSVLGEQLAADVLEDPAWHTLAAALAERVLTHPAGAPGAAADLTRAAQARELDTAQSAAQVLTSRLEDRPVSRAAHGASRAAGLPSWVPAAPTAGPAGDDLARWLRERQDRIRGRIDDLVAAAGAHPPGWVEDMPEDPDRCRVAMRDVLAYRDQWAISDDVGGLGPKPSTPGRQQAVWAQLRAEIAHARTAESQRPAGASTVVDQQPTRIEWRRGPRA